MQWAGASSLTRLKGEQSGDALTEVCSLDPVAAVDRRSQAYALADRGGDKFSGEVIRTLLTEAAGGSPFQRYVSLQCSCQ